MFSDLFFAWALVPPRTRGSSFRARFDKDVSIGSPAHAGIVPPAWLLVGSDLRFPRARGDRPMHLPLTPQHREVPPRTRGSSPVWVSLDMS